MTKKNEAHQLSWFTDEVDRLIARGDQAALDQIRRTIAAARRGYEGRPDVLVEELRRDGKHRLALMARGLTFQLDRTDNLRAAMDRIAEFLPEFDDPNNAEFTERACYLRHVGCVLSKVDHVGYRPRIRRIARAVLDMVQPDSCCAEHANLDLASAHIGAGELDEAEALITKVESLAEELPDEKAMSTRFKLDLARGETALAESRLDWLESQPFTSNDPVDEARRAARKAARRARLSAAQGDLARAGEHVEHALSLRPRCAAVIGAATNLAEALLVAGRYSEVLELTEAVTHDATDTGVVRNEVRLRLAWLKALERSGRARDAGPVAMPLVDARERLASDDLFPLIDGALAGLDLALPALEAP